MGESKKTTNETDNTEEGKDKVEDAVRVGTVWDARPIEEDDDEEETENEA